MKFVPSVDSITEYYMHMMPYYCFARGNVHGVGPGFFSIPALSLNLRYFDTWALRGSMKTKHCPMPGLLCASIET